MHSAMDTDIDTNYEMKDVSDAGTVNPPTTAH